MIAALLLPAALAAPVNELYLSMGGFTHASSRQLVAGAGGGLGYRRSEVLGPLNVHASVTGLVFSVPAVGLTAGSTVPLWQRGIYQPEAGLEVSTWWGAIKLVTAENPALLVGPAASASLRLRPAVFHLEGYDVSFAELAYGRAFEALSDSHTLDVTVMAMGRRW